MSIPGMRPTEEAVESYEDTVYRFRDRAGTTFKGLSPLLIDSLEAFEAGKVMVVINRGSTNEEADKRMKKLGLTVTKRHNLRGVVLYEVKVPKGKEKHWAKKLSNYAVVDCTYLNEYYERSLR